MNTLKLLLIAAACFFFLGTTFISNSFAAQELEILYGKGVHAFFDRNYDEVIDILSDADELKTDDPRPYYFLGLAYLQQKKSDQADQVFKKAAELEYGGRASRDYAVSESLRRIQGVDRQRIEKIRAEERVNAQKRAQRQQEIRHGENNVVNKEKVPQSTPPSPQENLAALEKLTADFDRNPFGARSVDPLTASEEIITVKRTENNPFGEVVIQKDTLPENIEITQIEKAPVIPPRRVDNTDSAETDEQAAGATPIRSAQATIAKDLGKGVRSFFTFISKAEPKIVTIEPANGAEGIDAASVKEIKITFDIDMNVETNGWLAFGNAEGFPRTTGEPSWTDSKTCVLPVELEPGKSYIFGIGTNIQKSTGFQSSDGIPLQNTPYKFTTM